MNLPVEKIIQCFSKNFSAQPVLYFSPGRINLIGEHVDYNDGFVMPAAIDKGIYYAIAANGTDAMNFYAADLNESFSITIHDIKRKDGWKNYVLGVVNEFLVSGKQIRGFDCAFGGDIPQGSGMSSSAAVEGGLAFALNELFNCNLDRVELALLCQHAEHNYPGVKCGIMDMYASLNGKKDHVLMLDCMNITHAYFPLRLNGYKIVLFDSKVHHSLAGGEYNARRKSCEEGLGILKDYLPVNSFRDIRDPSDVDQCKDKMSTTVYNCCRYVVEEIARTKKAATLLQQNEIDEFGKLMFETHEGLSKLYKVSCAELDLLVAQAKANPGVIGARLMGGGFGGCTINIIKQDLLDNTMMNISTAYREEFKRDPGVYMVETADGTKKITL